MGVHVEFNVNGRSAGMVGVETGSSISNGKQKPSHIQSFAKCALSLAMWMCCMMVAPPSSEHGRKRRRSKTFQGGVDACINKMHEKHARKCGGANSGATGSGDFPRTNAGVSTTGHSRTRGSMDSVDSFSVCTRPCRARVLAVT